MIWYTPKDVAMFLKVIDLPYSKERAMIQILYPQEIVQFEKKIDAELEKIEERHNVTRTQNEELESFFKVIKLRLLYQKDCDFVRLKLRTVLKQFGYKRRSEKMMNEIQSLLDQLQLVTALKGNIICSMREIELDDFIMIRLKVMNDTINEAKSRSNKRSDEGVKAAD